MGGALAPSNSVSSDMLVRVVNEGGKTGKQKGVKYEVSFVS